MNGNVITLLGIRCELKKSSNKSLGSIISYQKKEDTSKKDYRCLTECFAMLTNERIRLIIHYRFLQAIQDCVIQPPQKAVRN